MMPTQLLSLLLHRTPGGAVDEVKDGEIIVLFRVDTIDDAIESALKL